MQELFRETGKALKELWELRWDHRGGRNDQVTQYLVQWDNSSQPLPLSAECFLTSTPCLPLHHFLFLTLSLFFLCSHRISWTESETQPVRCVECRKQEMKRFLMTLWASFPVDLANHLASLPWTQEGVRLGRGRRTWTEAAKEASFSRRWKTNWSKPLILYIFEGEGNCAVWHIGS